MTEILERLEAIERRLAALEAETMMHRKLGPKPEALYDQAKADEFVEAVKEKLAEIREPDVPPVDRSARCMTSGNPEALDHREIDSATGQQKDYVILCE